MAWLGKMHVEFAIRWLGAYLHSIGANVDVWPSGGLKPYDHDIVDYVGLPSQTASRFSV